MTDLLCNDQSESGFGDQTGSNYSKTVSIFSNQTGSMIE